MESHRAPLGFRCVPRARDAAHGAGSNFGALLAALPDRLAHVEIVHVISSRPSAGGLVRAAAHDPPVPSSHFSLGSFKKTTGLTREAYDLELATRIRGTRPDLVVLAGWMLILSSEFLTALVRDWSEEDLQTEQSGKGTPLETVETKGASPYGAEESTRSGKGIPIINLHPALPGCFPGAHAILDAWNAFNLPPPTDELDLSKLSLEPETPAPTQPTPTAAVGRITKTGIMIHRVIPELDAGKPVVVREIPLVEGESLEDLEGRIHVVEHEAIVEAVGIVLSQLGDGTW